MPNHQSLAVHLTTHRLLFFPSVGAPSSADMTTSETPVDYLQLSLQDVRQTEYYLGFIKSSPKITLYLGHPVSKRKSGSASPGAAGTSTSATVGPRGSITHGMRSESPFGIQSDPDANTGTDSGASWTCSVCGYPNVVEPGRTTIAALKCKLCGMDRQKGGTVATTNQSGTKGSATNEGRGSPTSASYRSLESNAHEDESGRKPQDTSRLGTEGTIRQSSALSSSTTQSKTDESEIPCSMCTYLNHPSLAYCEMCNTPLHRGSNSGHTSSLSSSAPKVPKATTIPKSPRRFDTLEGETSGEGSGSGGSRTNSRSGTPQPGGGGASSGSLWLGMNTFSTTTVPAVGNGDGEDEMDLIRLSFRKGGDKEFYRRLKTVLVSKGWEKKSHSGQVTSFPRASDGRNTTLPGGTKSDIPSRAAVGIEGILQTITLESRATESNVQEAFKDLDELMIRAGEMVKLVKLMNQKLTTQEEARKRQQQQTSGALNSRAGTPTFDGTGTNTETQAQTETETEDQTFIRSSLVQMGLPSPAITQDMVHDEEEYLRSLAEELGQLLTGTTTGSSEHRRTGLMTGPSGRGIVGLDEIWCLWNRARGIALISPKTMASVIPLLGGFTNPKVKVLKLLGGSRVVHTPVYEPEEVSKRLMKRLRPDIRREQARTSVSTAPETEEAETEHTQRIETTEEPIEFEKSLTTIDFALSEGLSVTLAQELLEIIQMNLGSIVVDTQAAEGGAGDRWYRNVIVGQPLADGTK